MRTFSIALLVALLTSTTVSAETRSFNTTSAWDAGVKGSMDTTTNGAVCYYSPDSIFLNKTGNGYFGIADGCPSGSAEVKANGLVLSYDMQTIRSGKLTDFSKNGNDATITGSPTFTSPAKFGNGMDNITDSSYAKSPALSFSTTSYTWSVWLRINILTLGEHYVVGFRSDSMSVGILGSNLFIQYKDIVFQSNGYTFGTEYLMTGRYDAATSTYTAFRDGVAFNSIVTSPIAAGTESTWVGRYAGGESSSSALIDEALLFNRQLSNAEIGKMFQDGRPVFAASGAWTSPTVTSNFNPTFVGFVYGNVSANRAISKIAFRTTTGIEFWSKNVNLVSGSSYASYVNATAPGDWVFTISLISNRTGTPFVSVLTMQISSSPSPVTSWLVLLLLAMLWLGFFVAGTALKTGFFVILSGVSALLFAITAWTTTNDIPSSILLFAAAAFTLIWSVRVIMAERSAAG